MEMDLDVDQEVCRQWRSYTTARHTFESMASSSSCACNSQHPRWEYDVFLSFRGEDTREAFTGHLYKALENRGIHTFQDDKRLEHGASIPKELFEAIEKSQVALIVFSENYASSTWCLDELVKIMECNKINQCGKTLVIPIFFHVDPSTVRNQKGKFATAFVGHESRYNEIEGMQKVQRWKTALTAASNLKGYDIQQGVESDYIQEVVDEIWSKLCKSDVFYLANVVGINTHLENVKSLLEIGNNDVRIVGIWGMGGVGKTTIALAIFDTLSYLFEAACFLADIKETEKKNLHTLQNTLLSALLRKNDNYVSNKHHGMQMIQRTLCSKKVLIVLDDIDHRDHLDYLAGGLDWFGRGSRIIATTRDKHLMGKNDSVYEVTTLIEPEALQLFNQYAFKEEHPDESLKDLTLEVVNHAKGLPLALKVWGSLLHKRDISEWRSAIADMKKNSNSEIVGQLKISYDRLEPTQQNMFLDLACFFRGRKLAKIKPVLESCDFEVDIGLRVLIDRALVFIPADKDTIEMHDLIQEMGKSVVNIQNDLEKRSRLWLKEDIEEVLRNNMGTKAIEAIWAPNLHERISFTKEAMIKMRSLRILHISWKSDYPDFLNGSIEYLPNKLRWLDWHRYPWESLPANFGPRRLVHLQLQHCAMRYFWTEKKDLPHLRTLDVRCSIWLKRTPDFGGMPNLEYLNFRDCSNLEQVDHSVGCCRKLIRLDFRGCCKLESLPEEIGYLENLEVLDARWTAISRPPSSIVRLNKLKSLSFLHPSNFGVSFRFPPVGEGLRSLESLDLPCCNLTDGGLPEDIGCLSSLKHLYLNCSYFEHLPRSITQLLSLESLNLSKCALTDVPEDIGCLSSLKSLSLERSVLEHLPRSITQLVSLESLDLSYCNLTDGGLPEDIGRLSSLKSLSLEGNIFEHLPRSITQLCALKSLKLSCCKRLKELPELPPELKELIADCTVILKDIHSLATKKKFLMLTVENACLDNDSICNLFAHALYSKQQEISASDFLSPIVVPIAFLGWKDIPSWFHYQGEKKSVSIDLPKNWYICDNFLGFAVCYTDGLFETTIQLIPLCDDGEMSWMTLKPAIHKYRGVYYFANKVNFFVVPFADLWDTSKADGKTPNDYGHIRISIFGGSNLYGLRLLYKDDPKFELESEDNDVPELESFLQMKENNDEPAEHYIGIRRSRYDNNELDGEASCSNVKKQRAHST